jgi:hypothetical protein
VQFLARRAAGVPAVGVGIVSVVVGPKAKPYKRTPVKSAVKSSTVESTANEASTKAAAVETTASEASMETAAAKAVSVAAATLNESFNGDGTVVSYLGNVRRTIMKLRQWH